MNTENVSQEGKEDKKVLPPEDKKQTNDDTSPGDELSDVDAKELVKKLRDENAKLRVKAKGSEDQLSKLAEKLSKFEKGLKTIVGAEEDSEEDPEEALGRLRAINEEQNLEHVLKDVALEHGLNKSSYKYFKFLMAEKFATLDEDEEVTEEEIEEFVLQAKKVGGQGSSAKTSVNGSTDAKTASTGNEEITVEDFKAMSITQKSKLYQDNKALYDKLYMLSQKAK